MRVQYSIGMSAVLSTPSIDDPFESLNDQQRAAVRHGDDGDVRPLLVIPGAGSGKTMTLASRVAHLVRRGADPQRLLLLTFSRRAAGEMVQRAGHLLPRRRCPGPVPSTLSARGYCATMPRRSDCPTTSQCSTAPTRKILWRWGATLRA